MEAPLFCPARFDAFVCGVGCVCVWKMGFLQPRVWLVSGNSLIHYSVCARSKCAIALCTSLWVAGFLVFPRLVSTQTMSQLRGFQKSRGLTAVLCDNAHTICVPSRCCVTRTFFLPVVFFFAAIIAYFGGKIPALWGFFLVATQHNFATFFCTHTHSLSRGVCDRHIVCGVILRS